MRVENKRGQTWSFDLIVAVIIFIVVVGVFYSLLNRSGEGVVDTSSLELDAKSISHQLNCDVSPIHPPCFIENGEVNETKFEEVAKLDYDELKELLGTSEDFCFYLLDEEGRVIPAVPEGADPLIDPVIPGVGSDDYLITNTLGCNGAVI